jgi:phosphatidylinositol alpha-1,6-mannosyltransferase
VRHLFVTQDYAPDSGGMARRHVELCRRFAPEEVRVSTVDADRAFDAGERYEINRQPFAFAGAKVFTNQVRWARWLSQQCRRSVDLLHCGNIRPCGYAVWWAHRRAKVPYLLYVNGGDLLRERQKAGESRVKRAVTRAILGEAAGIVANSRWTAEIAESVAGEVGCLTVPPVAAIDLGTDPAQFHPTRDRGLVRGRFSLGNAPMMLTVARLVPHKGQDVAIRALAALTHRFSDLRYVIVGEGSDRARLEDLARALGVHDRVLFAGPLTDDEIADAYATATMYVGPSRIERELYVEGFGISFVEAAASGIPSVAGNSGGVASAVRNGETGILAPPTDVQAFAEAIALLLDDAVRRLAMGRAARLAVETHFNWDRVARETLAFAHRVGEVA